MRVCVCVSVYIYRVRQWNLTFFERLVYESRVSSCHGRGSIGSVRFCSVSCHGAVGASTRRVRCGDFFKNGELVTVTQRKFRLHFNVARHHETQYFFGCTSSVPQLLQRRRNKVGLHERSEHRKTLRPCGMLLSRARVDLQYAMCKLWDCLTLLFGEFYTKIWTSTRTN